VLPFGPDRAAQAEAFVAAARAVGVERLVRQSAIGAGTGPITFARWHGQVDDLIAGAGLAATVLRPTSFMQNYVNYAATTIRSQGAFYLPHGDCKVSVIDARDVAAVGVAALTEEGHAGKTYDLTGPQALSDREIAAILSEVLGWTITYHNVPDEAARAAMGELGLPDVLADALLELYGIERAGYVATITPTVEQVTGRPAHSFVAFAHDYRAAFS
jgi:uncharacterized protein YbjT (DUF2867 family)